LRNSPRIRGKIKRDYGESLITRISKRDWGTQGETEVKRLGRDTVKSLGKKKYSRYFFKGWGWDEDLPRKGEFRLYQEASTLCPKNRRK
jgi:hypothetical protein